MSCEAQWWNPLCHQNQVLQRCSLCELVWLPVVVGPQRTWTHWQVRLVPGLAGSEAWLPLLQTLWGVGQAFSVASYKAQCQLLQTHCCVLVLTEATHPVWQELLWRGASLDGFSGKHQGGFNSVSKVNGECQKWCLPVSDQLGGKRVKKIEKMVPHHF